MAFNPGNLTKWTIENVQGTPQLFGYNAKDDTIAQVSTSGYFNIFGNSNSPASPNPQIFSVGDQIWTECSDGNTALAVTSLNPTVTGVVNNPIGAGTIVTADLANLCVTAGKIANATITTTQISATAGITGAQLAAAAAITGAQIAAGANIVGTQLSATAAIAGTQLAAGANIAGSQLAATAAIAGTQLAANTIDSSRLALTTIQYVSVSMSAAEWNGMFATPKLMIAAPGAGKLISIVNARLVVTYGGAQFAAGGVAGLQYDSTINGNGTLASATIAAATAQGWAAANTIGLAGDLVNGVSSATINKAIYMSNKTGAFTTGTSTILVHIWYNVVTA